MTAPHVVSLSRYPVKGLSPEPLQAVDLEAGTYFPGDRILAIENGPSGYDPAAPAHMTKIKFLMLMRQGRLAALKTRFDHSANMLTVAHQGREVLRADLSSAAGRKALEAFLADFCAGETAGPLRVLAAPREPTSVPFRFTDSRSGFVSIVNLASIRDLERAIGHAVDPVRFRANVVVGGLPAWAEQNWVGRSFAFGTAHLEGIKMIDRCNATTVNPISGENDLDVPAALRRTYGHVDLGIYAEIKSSGRVAVGDPVTETA